MDFWELMRVEASHWYWSFPLMFTFIICNKKLRFYCDFCHQKVLKKNCQHFLVNKKHGWRFLYNLDEVQDPFLTFFSYNGGSFFIDFLSRTKLLMHWKCFGSILKQVFYSLFSSISTQSVINQNHVFVVMSKRKHGRSGASTVEEDIDFAMNRGISKQRKRKCHYSILLWYNARRELYFPNLRTLFKKIAQKLDFWP